MAIYTKKGDKGETKVFDAKTGELKGVSKKSCQIRSIGTIDELNSFLGIIRSETSDDFLEKRIIGLQGNLFVINSMLAGSELKFPDAEVKELEKEIDEWEGTLPVLKNFIFYGGSKQSALIFYARALCRKAERSLVLLSKKKELDPAIMKYINRLSDYLFMLARYENHINKIEDKYWIGRKDR